jgi:hypothetical protein
MDLKKLAERLTKDVCNVLARPPTDAERTAIGRVIDRAIVDATGQSHQSCKETVVFCCGHEADLAHKIQEQLDKDREMLVANLMAMR